MDLAALWFVAIAVLWAGYFFLEGFDFGVGMLLRVLGRDDAERTGVIDTISGVWDGNEVWLIVAAGATFAAFPLWYATMFSGLYVPLLIILLALIVRGVAFEFRGHSDDPWWRARWEAALIVGSAVPAVLWGVIWGSILRGLPIGPGYVFTGDLGDLVSGYGLIGGLTTLVLFTLHGALFLMLRTTGAPARRARTVAMWLGPVAIVLAAVFLIRTQVHRGSTATLVTGVVAVVALLGAWLLTRARTAAWAFVLTGTGIVAGTATLFLALFPAVLPSSLDPAFDITVQAASSSPYTLTIMTWVAAIFLPVVLAYQAWTYWVFAKRIGMRAGHAAPG
ncbi:cytochrome d ubiquinol oxidase subunit II [Pseudonocardia sp. H11422]|uniref:cytochrome d ubiquinol oxidase subunit II n=1 Tax=Pseudonocardia sp. H11422 TaxID=2835866 RepID=UPI001BDBBE05|nr:cytochrome d ubiquinol oxidase subunit II [Pseudonocardia sp. H11422]